MKIKNALLLGAFSAAIAGAPIGCGIDDCEKARDCCSAVATAVGDGETEVVCEIDDSDAQACSDFIDLLVLAAQSDNVEVPAACE